MDALLNQFGILEKRRFIRCFFGGLFRSAGGGERERQFVIRAGDAVNRMGNGVIEIALEHRCGELAARGDVHDVSVD